MNVHYISPQAIVAAVRASNARRDLATFADDLRQADNWWRLGYWGFVAIIATFLGLAWWWIGGQHG